MTTRLSVIPERKQARANDSQGAERQRLHVDAQGLAHDLKKAIEGEVRFDDGSRALYATDGSNYRQVPIGVVIPRSAQDVTETVRLCRAYEAPLLSRGGGTSLAGQCCNVAVVMDFSKYLRNIRKIDPERKLARVEPGTVCQDLRDAAERVGLTFGPDPATHKWCTLGGMIGNNSCGVHSQMAGRTADNVHELDVLLYDGMRMRVGKTSNEELAAIVRAGGRRGEIYGRLKKLIDRYAPLIRERYPKIPRRVSGYNLDALLPEEGFQVARALVGSEGTCVVVLEAVLNLVHSPPARSLLILGYEDVYQAGDHVPEVAQFKPVGLEALDRKFVADLQKKHLQLDHLKLFPKGTGFLLVEFGGQTKQESDQKARELMEVLRKKGNAPDMKLFDDPREERQVWEVREAGLGATAHIPGEEENWEGWEDAAVAPEQVGDYLREFRGLMQEFGYVGSLYGHFGQGCIHTRLNFGLKTAEGIRTWRRFMEKATDLIVKYHGSYSGEHGDGQSRAEFLPKLFGPELIEAFEEFKSIWDPDWKMNPGKLVRPYRIDENLRYGADYHPPQVQTHFKYMGDGYSFARAMERCVGVGKCRRHDAGTMCPSYMATREEKHSTRGRARLLFEMLQGDAVHEGWKSEAVKDALDLCLSCKGCKGDCPVHVDMATYKAEFLSHYWEGRIRPRHAFAFGLIHVWARLGSLAPTLVNFATQTPGLRTVARFLAGMTQRRRVPKFAPVTFKQWWKSRPVRDAGKPAVILWADTFNDHFHPETAKAAVEVLEFAGFQVRVPEADLCCGRPLYDYGMLELAQRRLRQILVSLRPDIEAGTPVVVLEPSCAAVFRDEMSNLFPNDLDARRLKEQVYLLSEFLQKKAKKVRFPRLERKALMHVHCHHKAVFGAGDEEALLERIGLVVRAPDTGCCGMAGAFGFEPGEHFEVSIHAGERVLLPEVRKAAEDEIILANGFSCREQVSQCTDREALHLAQVLQMAIHGGQRGGRPEEPLVLQRAAEERRAQVRTVALLAAVAAVGGGIVSLLRSRSAQPHQRKSLRERVRALA